jgi:hypothetical protein
MGAVRYFSIWAILTVFTVSSVLGGEPPSVSLRGHLRQDPGKPPVIETDDRRRIALDGDEPTMKVAGDARLKDSDFEVAGHYSGVGRFEIDKIHLPSLFVYRNGKRLQVSYWCDVCYIRTSSPGKCWCCQKETGLDPVEPEH